MDAIPERMNPTGEKPVIPLDPALDPKALVSVVVPLKNEEESLPELHKSVAEAFKALGRDFEIVFVDDGSTDGSFKALQKLYEEDPERVRVIKFRMNQGKSAALSAGFEFCRGEIVVTMDADLQDDPAEIPRFLEALGKGADLVSGWKKVRHDPWLKVVSSRFFNWVVSTAAGLKLHDYNCGFKAYRREVLEEIQIYGDLHRYIPFLAKARGFLVDEIVVKHHARKKGRSKYGWTRYFRGFFDLFTVIMLTRFRRNPLHLFGWIGSILFLGGTLINLVLTWQWIHKQWIGDRPLLFLGVLLMVVGVQTFTIGLLGEMINSLKPSDKSDRPIKTILK